MTPDEIMNLAVAESRISKDNIKEVCILPQMPARRMTLKRAGTLIAIELKDDSIDPNTFFVEVYENPVEVVIPSVI